MATCRHRKNRWPRQSSACNYNTIYFSQVFAFHCDVRRYNVARLVERQVRGGEGAEEIAVTLAKKLEGNALMEAGTER
jgi:hypothetical protein